MQRIKLRHRPVFILCLLVLVFAAPFIGARLLYANRATLEKEKTINHGTLIRPAFSITQLTLYNANHQKIDNLHDRYAPGTPPNAKRTNGKWMLMLLYPQECNKACQKQLYFLQQIRLATGKDRNRVERAILTEQKGQHTKLSRLLKRSFVGTRWLTADTNQIRHVLSNHIKLPYATQAGTIYLVDPFGNVVLAYKRNENPNNILKDLKRLLKVSKIG